LQEEEEILFVALCFYNMFISHSKIIKMEEAIYGKLLQRLLVAQNISGIEVSPILLVFRGNISFEFSTIQM